MHAKFVSAAVFRIRNSKASLKWNTDIFPEVANGPRIHLLYVLILSKSVSTCPYCGVHLTLCKPVKLYVTCAPHLVFPASVFLPLSVSEGRVALRWQLARLIPVREGLGPTPGVTQTCQA